MEHAAPSMRARKGSPWPVPLLATMVFAATLAASLTALERWPRSVRVQEAVVILVGASLALLAAVSVLRRRSQWRRPLALLLTKLRDIRAGVAPIEELSEVEGELAPLVPALREILRELRRQKAQLARLEEETQQRVARRTDALERVIGTLRQQAIKDPLTGLYNRRLLDESLPTLIERCREQQCDLSVLMMDLDHFKQLNDTLGHAAGDRLLRDVGQLIRSTIREHDLAFRCGGDEFVVLLPGGANTAAASLGQRLQALVSGLSRTLRVIRPVALSVGISAMSEMPRATATELMAEADRRLYESKEARR